ncbi:MAG TPA: thiamine phosphate synthase [Candidatus Binataceae bacterium]|nr:thiamine phosphate synthase [Candidatus Binataceae bacterium]
MGSERRVTFRLYLVTDRTMVRSGDLIEACAAALEVAPPGTVALQLREKDLDGGDLYRLALGLREVCARAGAPLLINERVDVAMAAGADGVHLPFDSIGATLARRLLGPDRLIGVSTHSAPDVAAAAREGAADFAVFGPLFESISKPGYRPRPGASDGREVWRAGDIPVFAIGGITPARARQLMQRSETPAGVAAIGAILGADSPGDAMRAMLTTLDVPAR